MQLSAMFQKLRKDQGDTSEEDKEKDKSWVIEEGDKTSPRDWQFVQEKSTTVTFKDVLLRGKK
jgi:hypothetical protein